MVAGFLPGRAGATDNALQSRIPVVVGGYQFEPFVEENGGVSRALVAFLNKAQDTYDFQFLEIPARRRYDLMDEGKLDALFFEMMVWGWENRADLVATTPTVLTGSELFVARKDAASGADDTDGLFDDMYGKRLALTLGYHYGFAEFNADPDYLRENYDVIFSEYQRYTLRHVLAGTADLAVVNDSYLDRAFQKDEALRDRIIVSPTPDQCYALPVMVRKGGPIPLADMTALLARLKASGELAAFFEQEGLGRFLVWE